MSYFFDRRAARQFQSSGVGTNEGVTVTQAASGSRTYACTGIQCSGDAAALVTIESPASTVLYRKRFAAAFNVSERFDVPIVGAQGQAIRVVISASTSNCEANIQGISTGI